MQIRRLTRWHGVSNNCFFFIIRSGHGWKKSKFVIMFSLKALKPFVRTRWHEGGKFSHFLIVFYDDLNALSRSWDLERSSSRLEGGLAFDCLKVWHPIEGAHVKQNVVFTPPCHAGSHHQLSTWRCERLHEGHLQATLNLIRKPQWRGKKKTRHRSDSWSRSSASRMAQVTQTGSIGLLLLSNAAAAVVTINKGGSAPFPRW